MTSLLTIACILCALIVLGILAVIDFRTRLLPNKYVGVFFVLGIIFHALTNFYFADVMDLALGLVAGGGLLLIIRQIANRMHERDTLGLGDVKLMGAAGLWLGLNHIFLAISVGASAGLIHGVAYKFYQQRKTGEHVPLAGLAIPAGPGFIAGIIVAGLIKFSTLPQFLGF